MPNISVQLRRGTTAEHNTFTGAEGEVTVDTDLDTLRVHDGSTAGGVRLAKHSELAGAAGNTDLGNTPAASSVEITSSTGTNTTVAGATTSLAGVMTGADKTKLNGIATNATANAGTVTSVATGTGLTGGPITASGTLSIAGNGVTSTELQSDAANDANRAVTTNHIKDAAVTNAKLANGSVQSAQISVNAVGQAAMQNDSIGTNELIGNAVTFAKIQQIDNLRVIGNVSGSTGNTGAVEIKNENDLGSNSATSLATQASIKAYVDAQVTSALSSWDSGWVTQDNQTSPTSLANNRTLTFSHTLGVLPKSVTVYVATNSSGANNVLMHTVYQLDANNITSYHRNCTVQNLSTSSLDIVTGGNYFNASGTQVSWATANTHIRVIALG